ncbi:MAG: hypothetical protein HY873_04175 [Chloroflexi bacterium]|nr:hypothetical protein [Chloroflexota bacterium]
MNEARPHATAGTSREVTIVSTDATRSMSLAVALRGTPYDITVVGARPSRSGLPDAAIHGAPAAIVMEIEAAPDVVELRSMLGQHPRSRFLFLAAQLPLRSAVARIIRDHRGAVLARSEPSIVVVATLVALLTGEQP